MSKTNDTREAIIAALKALPSLAGVDVRSASDLDGVYEVFPRGSGIAVIYGGLEGGASPSVMGNRLRDFTTQTWRIVALSTSLQSPTSSHKSADELAEAVRDIRSTPVTLADGQTIYMTLQSETLAEPGDRPTQGGPVAYICEYRTSQIVV